MYFLILERMLRVLPVVVEVVVVLVVSQYIFSL